MKKVIFALALMAAATHPALAQDTLYADMGGKEGIDRLVEASVDIYLADPRIKTAFGETNIDRLRAQLKDQFCAVAGGPCEYKGHSMVEAHKGLSLTGFDFHTLVEDLQIAMDKVGIGFPIQNRFLARLAPMKGDVVTK